MPDSGHQRLILPGPVEVRAEILQAQTTWMIGHRSAAFETLFASLQQKLRQVFLTDSRVFISGSSGSGFWEGALRNSIRPGRKVLHLTGGAFGERWAQVSRANGIDVDVIAVDWGRAHDAQMVSAALQRERYDAVCVVHNETSTGVTNPLRTIAAAVREHEERCCWLTRSAASPAPSCTRTIGASTSPSPPRRRPSPCRPASPSPA